MFAQNVEANMQDSKSATGNRTKMPVIFAAHGAPVLLDDKVWMAELLGWAKSMPRPESILVISAHWEQRPTTLGATRTVPLVYDFVGFPERYYHAEYTCPGAHGLAVRVRQLFERQRRWCADDPDRGLDHGAYIPLVAMYPEADIPVLQLSMPGLVPEELFALGGLLSPLRDEGVLIFGSGFLTHNMGFAFRLGVPDWARRFDAWVADAVERLDFEALKNFQDVAPDVDMALPTWEHYAPLLVAAGAVADEKPVVKFPITGWWMDGAFTRRSVQFG